MPNRGGHFPGGAPVLLGLDGEGPLNRRLFAALRRAILEGRLAPGQRLPSSRALAADLGLSRKVVALAFERLAGEGYIEGRVGAGTFVSETLPDAALAPWRGRPAARVETGPLRLSAHARRLLSLAPWPPPGRSPSQPLRYNFHYGSPAIDDFPQETWCRLVGRRARAMSRRTLGYGRTLGYAPLRKAIAEYVSRARGVAADPEQVVIVNGSQQALDLLARLLVDPGDRVVVEDPGYQGARQALASMGARVLKGPVDASGLQVSALPRGEPVRLAYVTPSHQFPLGGILPLERRLELLRWAEETGAYIVEDDYDSEFRYEGHPVEAVQALDRSGRVLYVGTFSKVLFPSLRLAYVVVPHAFVPVLAAQKLLADYCSPTFEQELLTEFIAEGHFERHLRRTRARNAARRKALLEAFDRHLGDAVEIAGANAGVHVVAWLRGLTAPRVVRLCRAAVHHGLGIYPVSPYYAAPPRRGGLLLGYACLSPGDIGDGIALLGRLLQRAAHDALPAAPPEMPALLDG